MSATTRRIEALIAHLNDVLSPDQASHLERLIASDAGSVSRALVLTYSAMADNAAAVRHCKPWLQEPAVLDVTRWLADVLDHEAPKRLLLGGGV